MADSRTATHVALLRGINVGGHRPLPMADLRSLCDSLGLSDVETYIQSGNVVFGADDAAPGELADRLSAAIADGFGYDVPVQVLPVEELLGVVGAAPWDDAEAGEEERRYVAFVDRPPASGAAAAFEATGDAAEAYAVTDRAVYATVRRPPGERRRFSNALVERELDVAATTRNWSVVGALAELASGRGR